MMTHKLKSRLTRRAAQRGVAMLEAVIVLSVFLVFFQGMIYFRLLYSNYLASIRLARAAAVSYAMTGCTGESNSGIANDLATDTFATVNSASTESGITDVTTNAGTGNGLGGASGSTGEFNDNIAKVTSSSTAAGGANYIFTSQASTTVYFACGETPQIGNLNTAISNIIDMFGSLSLF
jgi:hypothetical protein